MNIKRMAYEQVAEMLRRERNKIHFQIASNRMDINSLVEKQKKLKKEMAIFHSLIRELKIDFENDRGFLKPRKIKKGK